MTTIKRNTLVWSLLITLVVSIYYSTIESLLKSEQYRVSRHYVENDSSLSKKIGDIKGYGMWITGDLDNPEGESELSFTVRGTKRSIRTTIKLKKSLSGIWEVANAKYWDQ